MYDRLTENEHRKSILKYLAFCSYEDHLFGKIVAEAKKLAGDTVILYLSDHGDYCGDHGLWAKGLPCFEGAYRIPLLIYDSRVRFKKAGVTFSGIIPSEGMQMSLFDGGETRDNGKLMSVIDSINRKEGAGSVVFASQGFGGVKMNRGHLSPQYTTKFDDILKIKV